MFKRVNFIPRGKEQLKHQDQWILYSSCYNGYYVKPIVINKKPVTSKLKLTCGGGGVIEEN